MMCQNVSAQEVATAGNLHDVVLHSAILKENKIDLKTDRNIKVYLPPGYENSRKAYPVVYFLHNIFWDPVRMFADGRVVQLMERAFTQRIVGEFILVVADYSGAGPGSLYENSPISGRWIDFTVEELVPLIDSKYRSIKHKNSRAVVGEFMGGRGALKLGMTHANTFSVVYALHPVATGSGNLPWNAVAIDWNRIYAAKTLDELNDDGRTRLFVTVCQAFLPNPARPPFYCDYFMAIHNDQPVIQPENLIRAQQGFHLEETVRESTGNLKSLRGLAFDWGRFDATHDHVYSNRQFSRRLEDLGIKHEAEEYSGGPFDHIWTDDGRFYSRVLPFLAKHLVFNP